jgi:hypothetical protein
MVVHPAHGCSVHAQRSQGHARADVAFMVSRARWQAECSNDPAAVQASSFANSSYGLLASSLSLIGSLVARGQFDWGEDSKSCDTGRFNPTKTFSVCQSVELPALQPGGIHAPKGAGAAHSTARTYTITLHLDFRHRHKKWLCAVWVGPGRWPAMPALPHLTAADRLIALERGRSCSVLLSIVELHDVSCNLL